MTEFGSNCILRQPIDVNPTLIFEIRNYGDPLRDTGPWTAFSDTLQRFTTRMQSFADTLKELGIDFDDDLPGEPVDEPEPPKRDDLWGFAVGDRVRVKEPGAHHGMIGKVFWTGGCSIAKTSEMCRDTCPNVGFIATHRLWDNGTIKTLTSGQVTVPPSHLEHCD